MSEQSESGSSLLAEYWKFLKNRKKWLLRSFILILLLVSLVLALGESILEVPFKYLRFE